jgi:hypothetical protein
MILYQSKQMGRVNIFKCRVCWHGSFNGNGRAAAAEYRQQYPHCRVPYHSMFPHVYRTLRETGSFPQGNAEHEQHNIMEKMVFWVQCSGVHNQLYTEYPWWLVLQQHRYGGFCTPVAFIHITCKEYNTSYQFTHPMCNVVNGYRHTWTFFLTFSSHVRLSLLVVVLTVHGIPTLFFRAIFM